MITPMDHSASKRKQAKVNFAKTARGLLGTNDYIFGGYVRDLVADEEYKDLDIFFQSRSATHDFIARLRTTFGSTNVRANMERRCYHGHDKLFRTTVEVRTSEGYWIVLDLVRSYSCGDPFNSLDADVNALYMFADGVIHVAQRGCAVGMTADQIISRIKKKEYISHSNIDYDRRCNLEQKGYKQTQEFAMKTKKHYEIGDKVIVKTNSLGYPIESVGYPIESVYSTTVGQTETTIVGIHDDGGEFQYVVKCNLPDAWSLKDCWDELADFDEDYQGDAWSIPAETILGLVSEEKETNMSTDKNMGVVATLKSDASDAGYRIAAKQISRGARAGLLALMKAKGAKKSWIKAVSEMMDTEGGLATISVGLGWALKFVPGLKEDPRAIHLAKEFRVEGMAMGGNLLVEEVQEYFLPILMQIQNLPEPPKVRVSAEDRKARIQEDDTAAEEEAEAEAEAEQQTARA